MNDVLTAKKIMATTRFPDVNIILLFKQPIFLLKNIILLLKWPQNSVKLVYLFLIIIIGRTEFQHKWELD